MTYAFEDYARDEAGAMLGRFEYRLVRADFDGAAFDRVDLEIRVVDVFGSATLEEVRAGAVRRLREIAAEAGWDLGEVSP